MFCANVWFVARIVTPVLPPDRLSISRRVPDCCLGDVGQNDLAHSAGDVVEIADVFECL